MKQCAFPSGAFCSRGAPLARCKTTAVRGSMGHLRKIVVVADDNHDAADALAALIASMGSEAALAYDGREAVEACEVERASLAILDVEMPGSTAARLRD